MSPPSMKPQEFGERINHVPYVDRLGAYAIVFDPTKGIAAVWTSQGLFLPGGAAERGESLEETLRREVREECGYHLDLRGRIGETIEWFLAANDGTYYRLHSVFFETTFGAPVDAPSEPDHVLMWFEPSAAIMTLRRESQAWAVRQFLLH